MGPYCKFCSQRCFVPITAEWPEEVVAAYGRFSMAATCPAGKAFDKAKFGVCYDDRDQVAANQRIMAQLAPLWKRVYGAK